MAMFVTSVHEIMSKTYGIVFTGKMLNLPLGSVLIHVILLLNKIPGKNKAFILAFQI